MTLVSNRLRQDLLGTLRGTKGNSHHRTETSTQKRNNKLMNRNADSGWIRIQLLRGTFGVTKPARSMRQNLKRAAHGHFTMVSTMLCRLSKFQFRTVQLPIER